MPNTWQLHGKRVVYTAEVTDSDTGEKETYIGLTECNVRDRNAKHEGNCRHRHQPSTRLSPPIWHLKDQGHSYTTSWKILTRASTFNPSSGMCRLCMLEKFHIVFSPATASLNLRGEIFSSCRHRQAKLLDKT